MAFQIIDGRSRGPNTGVNQVSVAVLAQGVKDVGARFPVSIVVGTGLRDRLKWENGEQVSIAVGTGTDAGWLCLSKSDAPTTFTARHCNKDIKHGSLRILSRQLNFTNSKQIPSRACEHKVEGDLLYIRLPSALVPVVAQAAE